MRDREQGLESFKNALGMGERRQRLEPEMGGNHDTERDARTKMPARWGYQDREV